MKKMESAMDKIDEIDELQTYPNPKDRVKNLYQGKGYGHRTKDY